MIRAGFVQFNPRFGQVRNNVRRLEVLLQPVRADLLVIPELFNTGYQFASAREVDVLAEPIPNGYTTQKLCALAKRKKTFLVAGIPERRGSKFYNSAVLVGPQGYIGVYRKAHLFHEEKIWFSPGNTALRVWDIGVARVGIMICFDWFFPEVARTLSLKRADILCHPANLVLPHCPDAMITRSLENGVFSITANRTGVEARGGKPPFRYIGNSQVVTPNGEVLFRASRTRPAAQVVALDPSQARNKELTPYNHLLRDRRSELFRALVPARAARQTKS